MKGISVLLVPGLILLAIPFFLPYMKYDAMEFNGWINMKTRNWISIETILVGKETRLSYYPFLWSLITIPSVLIKKTKSSTITMIVISSLLTLFLVALYFLLTAEPSFYMGYYNVTPLSGYWVSLVGSIVFLIGTILSLKKINPSRARDDQLLDDSI